MNNISRLAVTIICFLLISSVVFAESPRVLHEKTFKTEPGKSLNINTTTGDIYISTWDKSEVYVKISGNRKAQDKVKFRFDSDGNGVTIQAKKDSWFSIFSFSSIYLKYEVKIPARYNSYLKTSGGDIKIYDLTGESKLETSGGDINLKHISGNISTSTSGGDIILEESKGEMYASTSGGDITILKCDGNLNASTSGGDIKLNVKGGKIEASTSGGNIELAYWDVNKGIDLSTSGGDINVKVPENFKANVDLSTSGGDVECELPVTAKGKISSTRLRGQINGGGSLLHCETSGGDIKVYNQNE